MSAEMKEIVHASCRSVCETFDVESSNKYDNTLLFLEEHGQGQSLVVIVDCHKGERYLE